MRQRLDAFELCLIFFKGIIIPHSPPGKLADSRKDGHVYAMMGALAEFCIGMLIIVDIQHKGCVHDMLMDLVRRDTHIGSCTHHIPYRAVCICAIFHKQLTCV